MSMRLLRYANWVSILFLVSALFLYFYTYPSPSSSTKMASEPSPKSIYDFTVKDIRGNDVSLSDYRGKVLLIVNVASKCGLTQSNYKELNVLYENYKNKGLEILAFPCNQFAGQEPGNNEEIQEVVCTMFKAEFPIFDKKLSTKKCCFCCLSVQQSSDSGNRVIIDVNGKNTAPLFKFLKSEKGGYFGDAIKWNFTKFLADKEGKVVARYAPTTSPLKIEVRAIFLDIGKRVLSNPGGSKL
ncbi:hypothetical protein Pint_06128 [Pistacia integerrima]|uniref:Uncharacterized protein n=1 Tax=Pistacia integerrima TaxID=434235 RepID=A0ACC0Z8D8_9ROSI|nr:hypothetical protein Pint_06128 [Pistacia integerrima]